MVNRQGWVVVIASVGLLIAGRLLGHLTRVAREQGIAVFEADVLSANKSMLAVFTRTGLPMQKRLDGGTVHVTLALSNAGT